MAYAEILYEVSDAIATLTLNRPDKLNAWTSQMGTEVRAAMLAAEEDATVRVIILTGAGRGFCAGADMGMLQSAAAPSGVDPALSRYNQSRQETMRIQVFSGAIATSPLLRSRLLPPSMARAQGLVLCSVYIAIFASPPIRRVWGLPLPAAA